MKKIIYQVTEAFSMQPVSFYVEKNFNDSWMKPHEYIDKIIIENVVVGCENGQPIEKMCYVGYDFSGNQKFLYMAETVNVIYDYIE